MILWFVMFSPIFPIWCRLISEVAHVLHLTRFSILEVFRNLRFLTNATFLYSNFLAIVGARFRANVEHEAFLILFQTRLSFLMQLLGPIEEKQK